MIMSHRRTKSYFIGTGVDIIDFIFYKNIALEECIKNGFIILHVFFKIIIM